jgi:hypothetical protein
VGHAPSLIAVVALASPAHADDFVPERIAVRAAGELGEDTQSLSLDAWYDVNARFRLGLTSSTDARHELAAETQIRVGPWLVGRAAIDTTRFAPTAAAIELGVDAHYATARYALLVAPILRLGIARRDLANGDTAAAFAQLAVRVWSRAGVLGAARIGVALDDLRATPTFGAAGGVYVDLGAFVVTARFGEQSGRVFGELALGWSS